MCLRFIWAKAKCHNAFGSFATHGLIGSGINVDLMLARPKEKEDLGWAGLGHTKARLRTEADTPDTLGLGILGFLI